MLHVTDTITIAERDIRERFVRASGPGGQNINKVSTAVELRFAIGASSLPEDVKDRLRKLARGRLTADDVLLIDSREHRTQARNREAARSRLVALVQQAARRPRTRRPTKPGAVAQQRRIDAKKRRGVVKALRGRARAEE